MSLNSTQFHPGFDGAGPASGKIFNSPKVRAVKTLTKKKAIPVTRPLKDEYKISIMRLN